MWRGSWRFLSQVRQTRNPPLLSRPPSAHLGLQTLRLQSHHDSRCSTLNGFPSSSFSTVAEPANIVNSVEPESISPVNHAEVELPPSNDYVAASSASASPVKSEEDQAESALSQIVEEHRKLVSSLRAELEEHKILTSSILDEIRVVKLKADAETTETKPSERKRPWPEWNAFMEHLQHSDYFKDEKKAHSSNGGSVFEDPTGVKRAIHKFSQAHESIFESLSQIDLRILARYGHSSADARAMAAQKRLRQHFHLEDILIEDLGDKSAAAAPKLSDVTRLLHSTIVEGAAEDDVRSSISHLLREIITLSRKSETSPHTNETTASSSRPSASLASDITESLKPGKVPKEKVEVQKTDVAVGDGRLNSQRAETRTEAPVQSQPQWKCPRCSFMNLDTKHRCVECSRRRPQRTYLADTPKSTENVTVVDEDTEDDPFIHEKESKKTKAQKDSLLCAPMPGRESSKPRSSVLETQEQYDTDNDTDLEQIRSDDVDIDAKDKDPFDVLDDILDSESSDNDSKQESRGSGTRTSLSGLFAKPPSAHSRGDKEQRNNFGRPERRRFDSKRYDGDDDNRRSRYGSVGGDEGDDSLDDEEAPSRRGRDDDSYPRRSGRGGNNTFRERGSSRGFRGDSYDERNSGGGPRSSRAFGDRDRGARSDSFGRRPSRGRPRY